MADPTAVDDVCKMQPNLVNPGLYDLPCEYCAGTVRERVLVREPISLNRGIVILENVPIGICDRCGAHYFAATVLKRAESLLTDSTADVRHVEVPVATY